MRYILPLLLSAVFSEKLLFGTKALKWSSQFKKRDIDGWNLLRTATPDENVIFIFGLKQRNVDFLEKLFWQISDPKNPMYGEYLSNDQITRLVGLSEDKILSFLMRLTNEPVHRSGTNLRTSKVSCEVNTNNDWLTCSITANNAMKLFEIPKFFVYSRPGSLKRYIRTHHPLIINAGAAAMIDYVGGAAGKLPSHWTKPTIDHDSMKEEIRGNFRHVGIYPTVIRERYNITDQVGGKSEINSQCTPQFLEQYYHQRDLNIFWKLYGKGYYHKDEIDKVVGQVDDGLSGIEASLDTQYMMSTGNNITTWFWYTAGRHEQQEPFLQWLIDLSNTEDPPLVNSASYSDKERTVDPAYMNRVDTEFMKAGVRGLTLLFASGDDGAGCHNNTLFEPQFPSSSPYITTIGGTAFIKPFGIGEEQGYDISGGGFSNFFDMPDYQKDAIKYYFENADDEKMPPETYYTKTGRGYPDMAAVSNHYWVVNNMVPVPGVLGTSASCPVIAGILAHVNDHRLAAGLPPLGFVNPLLYQNPEVMTDVTKGYNAGCDLSNFYDRGFFAEEGWDPVTGLGNPNFPPLLEIAMQAAIDKIQIYPLTEE